MQKALMVMIAGTASLAGFGGLVEAIINDAPIVAGLLLQADLATILASYAVMLTFTASAPLATVAIAKYY